MSAQTTEHVSMIERLLHFFASLTAKKVATTSEHVAEFADTLDQLETKWSEDSAAASEAGKTEGEAETETSTKTNGGRKRR